MSDERQSVVLHRYRLKETTPAEALKLGGAESRLLAYSPKECLFAFCGDITPEELDDAYEVRIFNQEREIRWVDSHGAVVLAEAELELSGWSYHPLKAWRAFRRYVLWGELDGPGQLFDHRVGTMEVPWREGGGGRLALTAVEYLAAEGPFGNVVVAAERLTGLERMKER